MNREQKELAYLQIVTGVMATVQQQSRSFPAPPPHPIAPPLNIGTRDGTVKPLQPIVSIIK